MMALALIFVIGSLNYCSAANLRGDVVTTRRLVVDKDETEMKKDQRVVVKYGFDDRCNNYKLRGCDDAAAVGKDQVKPYAGTESVHGIWYFRDQVAYEKDADTVKVSIEFGHDPRKDQRKHVIMMSADQSKYLEYDEVSHTDTDGTPTISRTFCKTSEPAAFPEAADELFKSQRFKRERVRRHLLANAHAPLRGDSRLDATSQAFHHHVRRNLLGFGHLHINLPQEQHRHLNNVAVADHERRALLEANGAIHFEPPVTTQHVEGKLLVASVEDVMALDVQSPFTQEEAENIRSYFKEGTHLSADVEADDASVPRSIIKSQDIDVLPGRIEWPQGDCVENLEGFMTNIPSRFELDEMLDLKGDQVHKTAAGQRLSELDAEAGSLHADEDEADHRRLNIIKNHLKKKAEKSLKKQIKKTICDADLSSWSDKSAKAGIGKSTWTTDSYPKPRTPGCIHMRDEVDRLYKNFRSLAKGDGSVLAKVDGAANSVMKGTKHLHSLEKGLKKISKKMRILDLVTAPLQFLPHVGGVIGHLRRAMKKTKKNLISPAKKKVEWFNNKMIELNIFEQACHVAQGTLPLATNMARATQLYDAAMEPIMYVDSACPKEMPFIEQDICQNTANVHKRFNDGVDAMQATTENIEALLKTPVNVINSVAKFMQNGAYQAFVSFLDSLDPVLEPLRELLNRQIAVSVPWPVMRTKKVCGDIPYPCGSKTCSMDTWLGTVTYPCGVEWCNKKVCTTISYPWFETKEVSFSVSDIASGAVSLVDTVMGPINIMIETLVNGLGIDMSALSLIPGFPAMPSFPSLISLPDLPKLPAMWPELPDLPLSLPNIGSGMCRVTSGIKGCSLKECKAKFQCDGFSTVFSDFPKKHKWKSVTASVDPSITSPSVTVSLSRTKGLEGTLTLPLSLKASFGIDMSDPIDTSYEVNIGEPMVYEQALPVGLIPLAMKFSLQPRLRGSLAVNGPFKAQVDITCDASLEVKFGSGSAAPIIKASDLKRVCTSKVTIEGRAEVDVRLEVEVDIDMSINDIVGAKVTPRIILDLNADAKEKVTVEASMDVTNELRLSAAKNSCADSFDLARNQLKFPASTCVFKIAEDKVCGKMDELFKVVVPKMRRITKHVQTIHSDFAYCSRDRTRQKACIPLSTS